MQLVSLLSDSGTSDYPLDAAEFTEYMSPGDGKKQGWGKSIKQ